MQEGLKDGLTLRNHSNEAYRNTMKQIPNILDVKFISKNYLDIPIPKNAVIYCDPPYKNTTKYSTGDFDYNKFWDWCRKASKDNYVFVSEYNAPNDFKCIWQKETLVNFDSNRNSNDKNNKRIEKLFIYNN